jgi:hypothetical protein
MISSDSDVVNRLENAMQAYTKAVKKAFPHPKNPRISAVSRG